MTVREHVRVLPSGEQAVVLELGDTIDPAVHDRVLALDRAVTRACVPGVLELVPTYRSLLVRIDPAVTTPGVVADAIGALSWPTDDQRPVGRRHEVAVRVDAAVADDLETVAERTGLTPTEVVAAVTDRPLRVYHLGFAPGFAYLGGLPSRVHLPRRSTPRGPVRPGSLITAAGQAALCPVSMPTGWWVIGVTDTVLFDPAVSPPTPFAPGDEVVLRVEGRP